MFTGIVRSLGAVHSIRQHDGKRGGEGGGCVLEVDLGALAAGANPAPVCVGDSIAVNGACLTVAELRGARARFDVSPETLARCLIGEWAAGERLNLEPALTLQTPLGGHLISGHIDGAGTLLERRRAADSECTRMQFAAPRAIGRLIASKGAIAVDGVSLTSNAVSDHPGRDPDPGLDHDQTRFDVMLVPHTLDATTLGALQPGARVHLEVDSVARYVARLMEADG